jgi:Ni/Co efflux regulator RcnB
MNVRLITACALAAAFLAVSGRVAFAQDRGQGRDQNQGQGANGQNNGQHNDQWNRDHHNSFNDQDRQVTRDWYQQHQRNLGRGWRQRDRLSPAMEGRLRPGQRLDPQLRRQMYWLPSDLSRRYGPAPRGYRYAIIGGNVVMLDDRYQVRDVFSLNLRF